MQQQQQEDFTEKWKRNFNLTAGLCMIHQRGIVVPMRNRWGVQALGTSCAWAFFLMLLWALFSQDVFMWGWLGVWTIYYLQRKAEATKLVKSGERIHSHSDGDSIDGARIGRSAKTAKLVVEPILVVAFGICLYLIYGELGMRPYGLPYFMLAGGITLPFVEQVKQQIWEKRIQAMTDARLENEAMVGDLRDRYGNS